MFLARVLIGCEPLVCEVSDREYVVTRMGGRQKISAFARSKHSWRIHSFGKDGGAALSDTPRNAIAAAKVMAEFGYIEAAKKRTRGI